MGWFKQAFYVEDPADIDPSASAQRSVDWIAHQIAKRHLTTPGLVCLEFCRPLNYIASQMMHLSEPLVWAVSSRHPFYESYQSFATFLEHRGSVEYICRRLEAIEEGYQRAPAQTAEATEQTETERKTEDGQ